MNLIKTLLTATWAISESSIDSYSQMVESFLNGNTTVFTEHVSAKSELIITAGKGIDDVEGSATKVVIIPIDSVITKDDYCGVMGTKSLDAKIKKYLADDSIAGIILDMDTPGGECSYLENVASTISNASKPILTIVTGMCASAGYFIASATDGIYAGVKSDMIGSIGTMCSFTTSNPKSTEARVIHSIYATKSTEKNRPFEEARQGKYDLMRISLLDPMNEIFHNQVKGGRANVNEEALGGALYYADDAIALGLVDGYSTIDDLVAKIFNQQNEEGMFSKFFNRVKSKNQNKMSKPLEKVSAIIGREFKEGDALTAEEQALVLASVESATEANSPEANTPPATAQGDLANTIKAAVHAAVAPINQKLDGIEGRIKGLENADGAPPAGADAGQSAQPKADYSSEPWNDPNNPINKAVDSALGK